MTRDPLPAQKCAEFALEKGDRRTAVEFLVLAKDEAKVRAPATESVGDGRLAAVLPLPCAVPWRGCHGGPSIF